MLLQSTHPTRAYRARSRRAARARVSPPDAARANAPRPAPSPRRAGTVPPRRASRPYRKVSSSVDRELRRVGVDQFYSTLRAGREREAWRRLAVLGRRDEEAQVVWAERLDDRTRAAQRDGGRRR